MSRRQNTSVGSKIALYGFLILMVLIGAFITFAIYVGGAWGGLLAIASIFGAPILFLVILIILLPVEIPIILALAILAIAERK